MPTESPPSAPSFPTTSLPLALRVVASGDAIRVMTAEDGELLGRFRGFDGETLVLGLAVDTEADIPATAIRAISRSSHRSLEAATVGALLGAAPFVWLALQVDRGIGSKIYEGLVTLAIVGALVFGAVLGLVGALVGGAIRRPEPLYAAPAAAP